MRGEQYLKVVGYIWEKAEPVFKRHGSTILTGVGVAGVVVTAVSSAKATPKAIELLDKAEEKKGAELTKMEKFKAAAPAYIPTALIGASTIACVVGSRVLDKRKQAALIAAYKVLDESYKEYRDKTTELFGESVDTKIKEEVAKDKYDQAEVETRAHHTDALLFYDQYSNRYFWRTMQEVREAEYHFNRNFALRGYAELNEFYEFLFLDPTEYGATVGWSMEAGGVFYGYSWVDFYHKYHPSDDPDTPAYYTIEMPFSPTADFMDY